MLVFAVFIVLLFITAARNQACTLEEEEAEEEAEYNIYLRNNTQGVVPLE
jgi:hypothetical protein